VRVAVSLFATLARFAPRGSDAGSVPIDLPDGSTVTAVVAALGIPPDTSYLALVNGEEAPAERPLAPGDVVTLFPPLAGGAAAA
jgi:molybdopterin converting factor small subunit